MRSVFVLLLLGMLTIVSLGCGSSTRPPPKEDTAANPTPEVMEIPKPDELPKE